jgi:tRNA/tmRNA/rRNA uracil-C5-methylase (TrmA/RlmC/RlmD family)
MSGAKRPFRGERARPAPLDRPNTVDVTIERIVGGGDGIGFAGGMTVFVPLTAPGDTVRARITRRKGKVAWGTVAEVLDPSPQRITPGCPYFGACGGCDFQQLGYEDQLAAKQGIVTDALRRIAKLTDLPDVPITPSPAPWRYRSRAEWQIDHARGAVGYFAAGSHTVVDVETCPISAEPVQTLLTTLRDDVAAGLVPETAREYRGVTGDLGSVLEPTGATDSREVSRTVLDDTYRFSAACFFQANIPVTATMVAEVNAIADAAREAPGIAIDLYCGVGLFTLPLARRFPRVVGVESFRPAAEYAKRNLTAANLANAHIAAAPVEGWLASDHSPLGHVALLVFDPPRTGAGADVVAGMLRLKPAHIAAVSCDAATFARDLRGLLDAGYRLETLRAFDLFPQTHHVEVIAHLVREAA